MSVDYSVLISLLAACSVILLVFVSRWFYLFRWSFSPKVAFDITQETERAQSDVLESYICKNSLFAASQFYIGKTHIWCQKKDKVLFDVALNDIESTEYSYSGLRFITADGKKYEVGPVMKASSGLGDLFFYYNQQATRKTILDELVVNLQLVGLKPIKARVSSRLNRVTLAWLVLAAILVFATVLL